ncbi:MAG: transporter substrate-binding domain-containing protein [Candidatus Cohnella colombiensis]|uniref:Transporter substrate-binding domain-containing protein n=1 Tax=Candidatus Cohnella colombiensis TaxID=3121368 RepID=A0AA95EYQ6_9BACL|nr:MAG: transporter substrate-binding domain-containing protein [Cohnella sp.]
MKKSIITLVALFFVVGLLVACGNKSSEQNSPNSSNSTNAQETGGSLQKIKDRGKLIVGVKTDFPPFGFVNNKGDFVGFEIALAKRFAKDLLGDESNIELVSVSGPNRIPYLQSDKVDLILAALSVSEERAKVIDFSNPYFKTAAQVLTRKNSGIQSIKDLDGKKVVVVKGSMADVYLTNNVPGAKLTKFEKNTEALQSLKDGRVDAYFQDNVMLYAWVNQNPDFHVLPEQTEPTPWAAGVKKGNTELKEWIDSDLETLGKEQFIHKLYDEHLKDVFGPDINPDDLVVE